MWKWKSLEEFLEELNQLEYLILRNYETLMEEIDLGGDIDILCADKQYLVNQIHALPIITGDNVFNYSVMIEDKKIPIDIREIGDGYYDAKWEKNMLANRLKAEKYYVLDNENYKYSLLYHVMIHKLIIPEKHIKKLENMFGMKIDNNERIDELLCRYMYEKGYSFFVPMDKGVTLNNENVSRLSKMLVKEEL